MKINIDLTPPPCTPKQQVFIDNICRFYGLPEKQMNSEEARTFLNKWAKGFFADMMERYRFNMRWYQGGYCTLEELGSEWV